MKKFLPYILSLFCIFSLVYFSACEKNCNLQFKENYIEMSIGDEIDIGDYLKLENIELSKVSLRSLDNSVVSISNGKATAVKAGSTFVEASFESKIANLEVNVVGDSLASDVPTGLMFDSQSGFLTWNSVLIKFDNQVKPVNSYTVNITSGNEVTEKIVVGDNKIALTESGTFVVKVKCNDFVVNGKIIYKGSLFSESLTLKKLIAPNNLVYDDQTKVLSWDADSSVTKFRVKVNDVLSEVVTEKQIQLDLTTKDISKQETFVISVISVDANKEENEILIESESEAKTLKRLYAPQMQIVDGVITWDNSQQGKFHYEITRIDSNGTEVTMQVPNGEYDLSGIASGQYNIVLKAVAETEDYLSSENLSELVSVIKLDKATLMFNPTTKVLSASNYEDKHIEIVISYRNRTETITLENGSYVWDKTDVGNYQVTAYTYAQTNSEINSDASNTINIVVLPKVDTASIVQKVENGKYYVDFSKDENYSYSLSYINEEEVSLVKQSDNCYGDVDTIFSQAKTYSVVITTSATSPNANTFVLPSRTIISVVRQPDLIVNLVKENNKPKTVNWEALSTASLYEYYINKNSNLQAQDTTVFNSLTVESFEYGHYSFFVKAKGSVSDGTLYLDSLNYSNIDFDIEYKLAKPEITFDRATKIVSIQKVENAVSYDIKLNSVNLVYDNTEEVITIDLSEKLNETKTYTFEVVAKNEDDDLVFDSDVSQITITKLVAPEKYNVSTEGIITIADYPNASYLDTDKEILLINEVDVASLDDTSNLFNIKAKFNAIKTRLENAYYLDSDYSTFTITRMDKPTKPTLSETVISWEENTNEHFNYRLTISQNGATKQVLLLANSIDVFDEQFEAFDIGKDFYVSVCHKFMGAQIDVNTTHNIYFTSPESDQTLIHKIESDINMRAYEENGVTTVTWDASEIEGVTYELSIDGTKIYEDAANSCDITEYCKDEQVYTLRLKIRKPGYISSEYVEIYVERLKNLQQFTIDENENIVYDTKYHDDTYVLVGSGDSYKIEKVVQLQNIEITCNENTNVTNLLGFDGSFTVNVKLIAKKYTQGRYYYLDSKLNSFNFTRIASLTAPVVNDDNITWDNIEGVDTYELEFSDGTQTFSVLRNSTNTLSVFEDDVALILNKLNGNSYSVKVRAVVGEFNILANETHKLSSYLSEKTDFNKLQKVSNIKIEASLDDFKQQDVKISWEYNFEGVKVKQFVVNIYRNNEKIASHNAVGTNNYIFATDMTSSGAYYAEVIAVGSQEFIDSDAETSSTITRLNCPTNLSVSEDATLTFTGVDKAEKYVVVYSNDGEIKGQKETTRASISLKDELLSQIFSGEVKIEVYAIGDGGIGANKTLSSGASAMLVVNKPKQGVVTLYSDKLVAGKNTSDEIDGIAKYIITITNSSRVVKRLELSYGDEYIFEDFVYEDTKEKVPTDVEQEFVITVQRKVNQNNYILSDTTQKQVTKLASIKNVGFIRKQADVNSTIWIRGDEVANAYKYVLNINDNTINTFTKESPYVFTALTEDVYPLFTPNWQFTIFAQGLINESAVSYIDSTKTTVEGKTLSSVTNFKVSQGVLAWDKNVLASDYAIKVNDAEILTGYVSGGNHTLKETLPGKSGNLTLNIKAVGNITTDLRTNDVILDSTYIMDSTSNTLSDYVCSKLSVPTNLKVVDGFIVIKEIDAENVVYQGVIDGNYYGCSVLGDEQLEFTKLYSGAMYALLKENTIYSVGMRAVTDMPDVIYSDVSDTINLKILGNGTAGSLKVALKELSFDPVKYDYATSQLVWNADPNAVNGYNLLMGNVLFTNIITNNYVLDQNEEFMSGASYMAAVAVAGSSEVGSDGAYSLNSNYAESIIFTKLNTPTLQISNGVLTWSRVNNALGYMIYLDGELIVGANEPINSTYYVLPKSNDTKNKDYASYEVRAVPSKDSPFIASSKALYADDEGNPLVVTQLKAPDIFTVEDGSLTWNITNALSLLPLLSGNVENPFTASKDSLINLTDIITLKLINKANGYEYSYNDYAAKYCKLSDSVKSLIKDNGVLTEEQLANLNYMGWPSLGNHFFELGMDLPAGAYRLSTRQLGDNLRYLTSHYGSEKEVYIPYAPSLELRYSGNSYILNWNNITIPSEYNVNPVRYVVMGQRVRIENGVTKYDRQILSGPDGIEATSFNLTELIESGVIDSSYNAFVVYVKGNNNNVLNGKPSNVITAKVLDKTSAYVHNGELYWNEQESAVEYLISYTEYNNPGSTKYVTVNEAHWLCDELSSDVESYFITIQAVGVKQSTKTNAIITGKTSNVGKIAKLATPIVTIKDGVFNWSCVEKGTSYNVFVRDGDNLLEIKNIANGANKDDVIVYESTHTQPNLLYTFQTVGDIDKLLDETTLAYVNSKKGQDTYGTTVPKVENIVARNGVLEWDVVSNNNLNISYYKIIFNAIDINGNPTNSEIVVKGNGFKSTSTTCSYDCAILDKGLYNVTIQGYFDTSDHMGKYTYNEQTAYYLIGVKSDVYTFEKYDTVKGFDESGEVNNVVIKDGKFTWEYAGENDPQNYNYELKFITKEKNIVVVTENNYYSGYVLETLTPNASFELEIRVVAKDGVTGYINSNYIKFHNIKNENSPQIYQLDGIQETNILLGKKNDSEDLHIIWESYVPSSNRIPVSINVKYLVTFWTSTQEEKQQVEVTSKYINTSIFQSSISDEYTLYYTLQVLPLGEQSYVASYPSNVREIQKPKSVSEVAYNANMQYFTWPTDGTSNDHNYKIKDEILKLDKNGNVVLNNGQPVVLRTYIFTTNDNITNIYYPIEMGAHKVSVAVVVKNSGGEGSLTSDYTYYYDKIAEPENKTTGTNVIVDLFKLRQTTESEYGATGTTQNPYLVETNEHFANINYRLSKPAYENRYTLRIDDVDQTVTLTGENAQFCFKQTADLTDVVPLGQGDVNTFSGAYDGDKHSISWIFDLKNIPSSKDKKQFVALFAKIGTGASVKNLKVSANITGELTIGASISMICFENAGTIDNIILGNEGDKFEITSKYDISWYGVTQANSSTISRVVNYYSVTLNNNTDALSRRANFAGIAGTNSGNISKCANYGDISLQTTISTSGGIVATNTGTIDQCVLKNSKTMINIAKDSRGSVTIRLGGIVGNNLGGTISYCYANTNTIVNRSAPSGTNEDVYIAGFAGVSNNGNISSSYVKNLITTYTTGAQIGNVYVFIANISSATAGSGEACYYNAGQTQTAVGGTGATNFNQIASYISVPSGTNLNKGNAYFTTNELNFPTLRWENEFVSLWAK